jgi:hypothetical protein
MKQLFSLVIAVLAGGSSVLGAGEPSAGRPVVAHLRELLHPTGTVRLNYFRSSKSLDDETDFLGVTTQAKFLPDFSEVVSGKLEVRVASSATGAVNQLHASVLEGYLAFHLPKADLRIGRQIVAWGRADGINPTDNLTPRDYVTLLPFEDDQRIGTTAITVDAHLAPDLALSLFTTPLFAPAKVPLPLAPGAFTYEKPARSWRNTEYGLRLNRTGESFDWSVSYYDGYSLLPSLRPSSSSLLIRHDRIAVYGADFARNFGRFGVRGEIAYMDTADRSGRDPGVRNPNLFFVLGVDRTFLENLNVNLQYYRRTIRNHQSPFAIADPAERAVAVQHALLNSERDRTSEGLTFRVSNKWLNNTLEAEIFGIISLTTRDGFFRPSVTYAFSDHWKATIGGDFYYGDADTPFGVQKSNRGAFAEVRYGF